MDQQTGQVAPGTAKIASDPGRTLEAGAEEARGTARAPLADPRIYALWDELVDFDVDRIDAAARHLMSKLCELGSAQHAMWVSAVRLAPERDRMRGWRAPVIRSLRERPPASAAARPRNWERRAPDPAFDDFIGGAGEFRHLALRSAMPPSWFASEYWTRYYVAAGVHDVLFVGFPLTPDAESHFAFFRVGEERPFSPDEIAPIAHALRGIKWFHRSLMLSHGLLAASTPLAPVERDILQGLLGRSTEKEIAAQLGLTYATTHQYVKQVFRKLGVQSRVALMRLWLAGRG